MDVLGNPYALLGVQPNASQDQIQAAYQAAVRRFEPDANDTHAASLIIDQVNSGYQILGDPNRRADFDLTRHNDTRASDGLNLTVVTSRQTLPRLDEPQLVYVMVTIDPPQGRIVADASSPLNLALVIDHSTSMQGPRLDQVKATTNRIIDSLQDHDIVTVILFADRAEVLLPASRPTDRRTMKATISTMRASGSTAMYEGLASGMQELSKSLHPRYVNHLVLITDGHTYGDEESCLKLAKKAYEQGISISAMGIGHDWNDEFLDELASRTGGTSDYIASHRAVSSFVENHIRSLGTTYAERARLIVASTPQTHLDSVFRIAPDPMPLSVASQPIPLGMLDLGRPTKLVLQFTVSELLDTSEPLDLGRFSLQADILRDEHAEHAHVDFFLDVGEGHSGDLPPAELVQALNKMSLYNLQDNAREALKSGNAEEATRALEFLATRLLEQGEDSLATAAIDEARRVASTKKISGSGGKNLKYGTRSLVQH